MEHRIGISLTFCPTFVYKKRVMIFLVLQFLLAGFLTGMALFSTSLSLTMISSSTDSTLPHLERESSIYRRNPLQNSKQKPIRSNQDFFVPSRISTRLEVCCALVVFLVTKKPNAEWLQITERANGPTLAE